MNSKKEENKVDVKNLSIPEIKVEDEPKVNDKKISQDFHVVELFSFEETQAINKGSKRKMYVEIVEPTIERQLKDSLELKYKELAERIAILEKRVSELDKRGKEGNT